MYLLSAVLPSQSSVYLDLHWCQPADSMANQQHLWLWCYPLPPAASVACSSKAQVRDLDHEDTAYLPRSLMVPWHLHASSSLQDWSVFLVVMIGSQNSRSQHPILVWLQVPASRNTRAGAEVEEVTGIPMERLVQFFRGLQVREQGENKEWQYHWVLLCDKHYCFPSSHLIPTTVLWD